MKSVAAAALLLLVSAAPAWCLSEIQREELPAPAAQGAQTPAPPTDPTVVPENDSGAAGPDATTPDAAPDDTDPGEAASNAPVPPVLYDLNALPEPVRRTHAALLEACQSADIEKLRPLLGSGDTAAQISLSDADGDPIALLKESSGDGQGLEILAILEEVLSAGFVHTDAGTPEELYVWPYFFAVPLDKLTARQQVELYKIVTSSDVEEMKTFGAYIFYRVGITPDGRLAFFVAGD